MKRFQEQEYSKNFNLKLWLNVLKNIKQHRKLMLILAAVMIASAGIDAVLPLMTKYAIDHFIVPKVYTHMVPFTGIFIGLVIFQSCLVWLLIALAGNLETSMNYGLRKDCYAHLQKMSFSFFDKTPTGWIVSRITSDINRLGDVIAWGIVDGAWGLAMIILVTGILFALNWKLALLVLTVVPILGIISAKFHVSILRNYRQVRKLNSQITNSFSEGIHGAKTTKTLVREDANLAEFQVLNTEMYRNSVKAAVTSALFFPCVMVVSTLGTAIALWYGGNSVIAKTIGYGTLVAFISYTMQFFDPIHHIAQIFAELQNAQAAAERVFSLIHAEPDIHDLVAYDEKWKAQRMQGEITIENITFAYDEGKAVFTDFALHIAQGESIAIVGETGTGKTTLVNLICRFYEPQQGIISIDGMDYRQMPLQWIHKHLGFVQQVPHLFQGTIRENIRYGRLDATDEEVIEAAKLVQADGFISALTDGYDYQVGEGGNLLSTGQKQLIAFARVVLANPALLILDEATASIDTQTEQLLQAAIDVVLEDRTSIIVAHRLSTIKKVDRILFMHKGKILEEGSHNALMKKHGKYYQLYLNQFIREQSDLILDMEA